MPVRQVLAALGFAEEKRKLVPFQGKGVLKGHETDVFYLIHHSERDEDGEWVVYIDQELDLDYEYLGGVEEELKQRPRRELLGEIVSGIAAIEPVAHNWPDDLKLQAKRSMGEAMVAVFRNDPKAARTALAQAQQFIATKSQQVSRYWILRVSLCLGTIAIVAAAIELTYRAPVIGVLGPMGYLLSLCFWSGCIGAVLFIVLRLGKQPVVDSTAERHLHYLEGFARVAGGGLAGVLVGVMIKLGLVLPMFSQLKEETLAMCAAAMVAGASERLAAGIVTRVEIADMPKKKERSNGSKASVVDLGTRQRGS
ncbi:MAG TPA: hypothetical protein VGH91_12575 [Gammaproteobacteria bacterium]|jgi:hypothetical protein